ncbi:helix-turn-helix domain-containing protein [Streptomyces crystallinus]|uniref:Helix-turn-helix domain-containing protein n=1 Tax=Streptomyces crystallinus TaxID=68191 RepID=A0ABN1FKS9_9ACTN
MRSTVLDTAELPIGERPEAWAEAMTLAQIPQHVTSLKTGTFQARVEMMPLGAGQLSLLSSYASVSVRRTARHVRQSDPEMYRVNVAMAGEIRIDQYGRQLLLRRGDLGFGDSSEPLDIHAGQAPARHLVLQFPKHLLRLPHERFTRLYGLSLPWTQGVGRLFGQFLTGVADEYAHCPPTAVEGLEATAVDLLSAVLEHHLGHDASSGGPAVSGASTHDALFLRMTAFIAEHLPDPALGPEDIAVAHHVSLRYLHRLFQDHGTTPRALIRTQRIDRCRRDLADPALGHLTIHALAARWGYPQPDSFSRAFRTATGMSPSEFRADASQSPPPADITYGEDRAPGRDRRYPVS